MAKVAPEQQALHGRHRRPHRDPPGTVHTFGFHRGRNRILGIICLAISAALSAVFVMGLVTGQIGSPVTELSAGESTAWNVMLFTGGGLFFLWGGIRAFRGRGVQVSGGKLIIHNELLTRRVDAGDICGITLEPKAVSQVATHWVACVELSDGESIWIDDFDGGTTRRPPRPELAAIVDEIRALLGVRADDMGQPGNQPQPDVENASLEGHD
jgi:hypothetical protein